MRLVVQPMELEDVPQVLEVDRESYTLPWPGSAYRREILHNRHARYLVLRGFDEGVAEQHKPGEEKPRLPFPFLRWSRSGGLHSTRPGEILGYAGMWLMVDEAHVTTIAVRQAHRGEGLGELLLASLVEEAFDMGAQRMTLEVRVSNESAKALYRKYGFHEDGVRRRYYSDNNEDAYIMTTESIRTDSYRGKLDELIAALHARLAGQSGREVEAPAFSRAGRATSAE